MTEHRTPNVDTKDAELRQIIDTTVQNTADRAIAFGSSALILINQYGVYEGQVLQALMGIANENLTDLKDFGFTEKAEAIRTDLYKRFGSKKEGDKK